MMPTPTTPLFSAHRIASAMQRVVPDLAIETIAVTGSTNADLLARIGQLSGPMLLVAEQQLAGRGRAGRTWHSSPAASLTFSLAWRFHRLIQALSGLSLVVGVALADALAQWGEHVQLKWPNDLLRDGKKLGGVLIETAMDPHDATSLWAVIGVGINLRQSEQLTTDVGHSIAALAATTFDDRNALLARLLDHLCSELASFDCNGFDEYVPRWNALHAYRNQQIRIIDRGQTLFEGVARGVDAQGRLLLDTRDGPRAVVAGDVSLRAMEA